MLNVSQIVNEVEWLGGGFRLESPFSDNPKLHYWLPRTGPTKARTYRERIFKRVKVHQHAIAEFVCLRAFLEAWQPPKGAPPQ